MPRQLRKRASRPNYVLLDDDDAPQPSTKQHVDDEDPGSESDFAPEKVQPEDDNNDESSLSNIDEDELTNPHSEHEERPQKTRNKATKSSAKRPKRTVAAAVPKASLTLPPSGFLPSLHHRHRAIPLYARQSPVERLAEKPSLFSSEKVVLTNAWGSSRLVLSRVSKAWGYNVGPGPLWDMIEDRGWFRESAEHMEEATEASRRPRVYTDLRIKAGYERLTAADAAPYLPKNAATSMASEPPKQTKYSFGPYGSQQSVEMHTFSRIAMENLFPDSKAHVFHAGAPVWAIDWCPIHPNDRTASSHTQYLAVGPLPSYDYAPRIGVKASRPSLSCIQIWAINPPRPDAPTEDGDMAYGRKSGFVSCPLVLCTDIGPAHDLKWCPLPSNGPLQGPSRLPARRLGLLAGTFEDGSVSVFEVPYPADVVLGEAKDGEPVYIKADPIVRLELEDTACWCLDWANSEVLAVGCANGCIAVYDIAEALRNPGDREATLPTHYFSVHQAAIRAVAWIRAPTATAPSDDPTAIVSAAYDGLVAASDIRTSSGNAVYRTRDVINAACYAPYGGGPLSIDQGQVKAVSFAPIMLNKGHSVLETEGPVWSLSASDYHPQLAVGSADGTCSTTNTLRTTRRGGSVPFLVHKIYQMDYSRETGEYRMLEKFLPKEIDKSAGPNTKSLPKSAGAWPAEVGVHRVVWNSGNGPGKASWLASATASGLCRVDWLEGRWARGRIPYVSVEGIRAEVEAEADDDDDDSD